MNNQQFIFVFFGSISLVMFGLMGAMALFERHQKKRAGAQPSLAANEQPTVHLCRLWQPVAGCLHRHGGGRAARRSEEETPYRGTGVSFTIR
jgi:hypothetical protein